MLDTIVIGGGFAGVAAARDLALTGRDILLLEARDRLGGRTWVRRFAGTTMELDFGGTWVLPDEHAGVMAELERYGIATRATPAPRAWANVLGDERVDEASLPPEEIAAVDAALRDGAARERTIADVLAGADAPPRAKAWASAYVRYLMGAEPGDVAASAMGHGDGLSVADPEHYSHKIDGGTRTLLEAMAGEAPVALRLGCTVIAVEQDDTSVRVTTADGDVLEARTAVVALPVNVWDGVAFTPGLPEPKRALAAERHAGHSVKTWILARDVPEVVRALASDGPIAYLRTERLLPGGRALLVAFGADPSLDPTDTAAVDAALRRLLPGSTVLASDGHDWNGDPWSLGTWFSPAPGQELAGLSEQCGRLLFAGGDVSADQFGTIDGAIVTGREAAAAALELLRAGEAESPALAGLS